MDDIAEQVALNSMIAQDDLRTIDTPMGEMYITEDSIVDVPVGEMRIEGVDHTVNVLAHHSRSREEAEYMYKKCMQGYTVRDAAYMWQRQRIAKLDTLETLIDISLRTLIETRTVLSMLVADTEVNARATCRGLLTKIEEVLYVLEEEH